MLSLLKAECRKLARPLVWGAGLAVVGFCLLRLRHARRERIGNGQHPRRTILAVAVGPLSADRDDGAGREDDAAMFDLLGAQPGRERGGSART